MGKSILAREIAATLAFCTLFSGSVHPIPAWAAEKCFYFDRLGASLEEGTESDKEHEVSETGKEQPGARYWNIGDAIIRNLDGERYVFRCIDQNYVDRSGQYKRGALFLCDQVVPADFGGRYDWEILEDGSHGYVWRPGPVANFGDTGEYRDSQVRQWMNAQKDYEDASWIATGVWSAYSGETGEGRFSQFDPSSLRQTWLGDQQLTDQLFVLSVEEALQYREWLWRFNGSGEENPHTQIDRYCKGYWLRNPAEAGGSLVYIVDLVRGNLRPESCGGDNIGVRPAFVLPQGFEEERGV